ncbi:glycosyl hydrolase 5 family protein-like [Fagus crenata]
MQGAAERVHSANPNVLVILSGLNYDKDLSFLGNKLVSLSFTGKLVLEAHRYGFTDTNIWKGRNANQACRIVVDDMMRTSGFLLRKGFPLFVSEFGMDLRDTNINDNRYMNCFLTYAAELDFDWALWTLTGSYYIKEGAIDFEEFYGVLNFNWTDIRNPKFLQRISAINSPFQGPGLSESNAHQLIFHPLTGLCVLRRSEFEPLTLGLCTKSEASWSYTLDKILSLKGTNFCIQANGPGMPAKLSNICNNSDSKWEIISDSMLHLSSTLADGTTICLDFKGNIVMTNTCICLSDNNACDPSSQWFKLIRSTRS